MAAVRREAPTKSFFSGPSHTLKKLVNAFPKPQKQSHHSSQQQQEGNQQHRLPPLAADCVGEEGDDEDDYEDDVAELDANDGYGSGATDISASLAAEEDSVDVDNGVDDDTEYSGGSEGEYPRPRIREDLLPHDFSAWQKSPSIAPYPHSETSTTSREAESFSEVLSSSASQDRHASQGKRITQASHSRSNGLVKHHSKPSHMEQDRNFSHIEPHRYSSPTLSSTIASFPAADLHLHQIRQNLPDLKLDMGLSGACRYGGPAGLKGLPEDCRSAPPNGASEDGRRYSVDGSCWQRRKVPDLVVTGGRRAQEIVDMIPLIEAYRAHQEDGQRGNFQHHASMVYTRAPSREALAKKVADSMNSRRASRNFRKAKKTSDAMWEEQENLPRRVKVDDLSRSPRRVSYENSVDIAKLQSQVEELQRKLKVREGVQHGVVESKDDSSEMLFIMKKVEELQRNVAERDQMLESANEAITQKEDVIQAMKKRLQDTQETCTELRSRNANREEEVSALRCEVAALRWQIEIDAERTRSEIETSVGVNEICGCTDSQRQGQEPEVCEMEAVRKMYLAALVVARRIPREECLALVGVLRIQLQRILRIPTSHLP